MAIVISGLSENTRTYPAIGSTVETVQTAKFNLYVLNISSAGELIISTSLNPDWGLFDTVLRVYDSGENLIATNDDFGGGRFSQVTYNFDVGIYYVALSGYGGINGTCNLEITGTAQLGSAPPPNPTPTPQPVSNIKIGYANLIDSSTLSATGVSENLPILNLKTLARGQIFRGSASSQTIEITFASPALVGCVALWLPTFTWIETDGFDAQIYNGASVVHTVTNALKSAFFTEVVATKVVLTIRAGMIFDLSRVFVGRVFTPTHNLEFGFSTKYHDLSESQRSEDGSLHIQKKAKYRQLTISLADITHADRAQLVRMVQNSGTQKEVFVSIFNQHDERDADNGLLRQDHELLGIFEDGAEISLTSPNRWNNKLVISEL